jgi:hypothetical protein
VFGEVAGWGDLLVLSLFVQRKNQRKGAENDNFSLLVRPLHIAVLALPNKLKFAPFSVCLRADRLPDNY